MSGENERWGEAEDEKEVELNLESFLPGRHKNVKPTKKERVKSKATIRAPFRISQEVKQAMDRVKKELGYSMQKIADRMLDPQKILDMYDL